jgi:hypothetical protein
MQSGATPAADEASAIGSGDAALAAETAGSQDEVEEVGQQGHGAGLPVERGGSMAG